ncbi:hypothetical protein VNO77_19312 [Canavalia gladiata]|uniref:Uncharacterized protein n=1 Tax=Canavalia gladiata TaxID=3824 RepID=A0AAN9LMI8_CANGL
MKQTHMTCMRLPRSQWAIDEVARGCSCMYLSRARANLACGLAIQQGHYLVYPVSLSETGVVSSFLLWPQIRGRTTACASLIFFLVVSSFRTRRRQKSTHLVRAVVISFFSKTPSRTTMASMDRLSGRRLHNSKFPSFASFSTLRCSTMHRGDSIMKSLFLRTVAANDESEETIEYAKAFPSPPSMRSSPILDLSPENSFLYQ